MYIRILQKIVNYMTYKIYMAKARKIIKENIGNETQIENEVKELISNDKRNRHKRISK